MLRHLSEYSLTFLRELYNAMWRNNLIPLIWKPTIIIPIPKLSKSPSIPLNHRAVDLAVHMMKLLENNVNINLVWFLENGDNLLPVMYGCRNSLLITDALVRGHHLLGFLQGIHVW